MSILVFNAGSTSLKFGLFSEPECALKLSGSLDWADGDRKHASLSLRAPGQGSLARQTVDVPDDDAAVRCALRSVLDAQGDGRGDLAEIRVVGHRIVHGGVDFVESVPIDAAVKATIGRWAELAPLHNVPALAIIAATEKALPESQHVAVFDTAFFAHLPPRVHVFPLPYAWYSEWGVRRFGFHGISHQYCASRAVEILARPLAGLRIVNCHLGGGCSAAAIRDGVAVASTLGFSTFDGLMMATRPGSFDPGILPYLTHRHGLTPNELIRAMSSESGLLGVSGVSSDFAAIEQAANAGNARARLAVEMFADRVRSAIGSLAVGMGGVDVVSFTDRVGENSPSLRALVCEGLECLGVRLDPRRNHDNRPDSDIAAADSAVRVLVIHTQEEWMIAQESLKTSRRCAAG